LSEFTSVYSESLLATFTRPAAHTRAGITSAIGCAIGSVLPPTPQIMRQGAGPRLPLASPGCVSAADSLCERPSTRERVCIVQSNPIAYSSAAPSPCVPVPVHPLTVATRHACGQMLGLLRSHICSSCTTWPWPRCKRAGRRAPSRVHRAPPASQTNVSVHPLRDARVQPSPRAALARCDPYPVLPSPGAALAPCVALASCRPRPVCDPRTVPPTAKMPPSRPSWHRIAGRTSPAKAAPPASKVLEL